VRITGARQAELTGVDVGNPRLGVFVGVAVFVGVLVGVAVPTIPPPPSMSVPSEFKEKSVTQYQSYLDAEL
jgi:hypothetical protein